MTWNPRQYLKFGSPRLRPALDLLARVELDAPATVCDLGCGTGQLTRLMAQRWPAARVIGVDGSRAMLDQAGSADGSIEWVHDDLARWRPPIAPDLIYSNAALHWLPDHATLLPALLGRLAPGGVLAVQMPRNFAAPSHTAIEATVRSGPWAARLLPLWRPTPVAEPAWYHERLTPHASSIDLWETEYLHVLEGADPVKEWVKGTWLAPFLDALDGDERDRFEREYAARVRAAYPPRDDGRTLFPFRRLFMVVQRA